MTDLYSRRTILTYGTATVAASTLLACPALASSAPIQFAVGPFLPTTDDTRKAWEPMFDSFAKSLGRPYKLAVTSDWAGVSIAMASGQADYGFVGPFGYILAKQRTKLEPLAVSVVNGAPTYKAIIVARKGLDLKAFPEDAKGLRISFADQGSTTGWLIPSYWFRKQGIDPTTYFDYRDGATHAANQAAVAAGQVDLATDNDRNRKIMIDRGTIKAEDSVIVWESDPVPNSLMAARAEADASLSAELKALLLSITPEQAAEIMPKNFSGWAPTQDSDYAFIEEAGIALGQIKAG